MEKVTITKEELVEIIKRKRITDDDIEIVYIEVCDSDGVETFSQDNFYMDISYKDKD